MLLIQSESDDHSTNEVLDWIYYLYPDREIVRLNDIARMKKISYSIDNDAEQLDINVEQSIVNTAKPINRWYRRGYLVSKEVPLTIGTKEELLLAQRAKSYVANELKPINSAIDHLLGDATHSINRQSDCNLSKTEQLALAAKSGLIIPGTLFTNDINDLVAFAAKHNNRIITKANGNNSFRVCLAGTDVCFSSDTHLLVRSDIKALEDKYRGHLLPLPSLFQQYIEKRFELRIFHLDTRFYAMAIFSQEDEKTKIDLRDYDRERPNRCVPYILPSAVADKLTRFMELIDMNSGSIDMICTPDGDYVFVEVNPVGQYQWLSKNCNYFIDREIAVFLNKTRNEH